MPDGEATLCPDISVFGKLKGNKKLPEMHFGIPLNIEISINEHTLLSGEYGIVWATYNLRQAEVITSALLAQNITALKVKVETDQGNLLLIKIDNKNDIPDAIDFIWRKKGGLMLKPDWTYPEGTPNTSFEKWLNG